MSVLPVRRIAAAAIWSAAALSLSALGAPPAEAEVSSEIARMGSADFVVREEAFRSLSAWARQDPAVRARLLRETARNADLEVRERARIILEETELDYAERVLSLPGLAERLRDRDESVVIEALRSLPPAAESASLLRRFLEGRPAWAHRLEVVDLLSRIPSPIVPEALLSCAKDPSDPARGYALGALGRLRVAEAEDLLLAVARDRTDPDRAEACGALVTLGSGRAGPVFRAILREGAREEIVRIAVLGLAYGGDPADAAELARLAGAPPGPERDDDAASLAVDGLGRLQDARAVDALLAILARRDDSPVLRRQACLSLGRLRAAEAVGPLLARLKDPAEPLQVRKAAVAALRRITGAFLEGTVQEQALFYSERTAK